MSWSTILSEYTSAIFKDSMMPLILSWIERIGVTTSKEISKDLQVDEYRLNSIINLLYQNKLVEITNENLKLTLRGKNVLDRLGVTNDILSSILKFSGLNVETSQPIIELFKFYRESSFDHYQKTVWSMNTWEK